MVETIKECCYCKKVLIEGEYKEVPSDYFDNIDHYFIHTHGYCPTCFASELKRFTKKKED